MGITYLLFSEGAMPEKAFEQIKGCFFVVVLMILKRFQMLYLFVSHHKNIVQYFYSTRLL